MSTFKFGFRSFVAGVLALSFPIAADATLLKITDLGTGDEEIVRAPTVDFNGVVGGFEIATASGSFTSTPDSYALNMTALQTSGVGKLRIALQKNGLTDFGGLSTALEGGAVLTDASRRIVVRHFVNVGSGWERLADAIEFYGRDGNAQSDSVSGSVLNGDGTFRLRTVIRINSGERNPSSALSTSLTALAPELTQTSSAGISPVPVPAAGFLLIGGLGALAAFGRRRRT